MMTPKEAAKIYEVPLDNITEDVVRKQYRLLTQRYHPDRETGDSDKFIAVCDAKNVLLLYIDNKDKNSSKNKEQETLMLVLTLKMHAEVLDGEISMRTSSYRTITRLAIFLALFGITSYFIFHSGKAIISISMLAISGFMFYIASRQRWSLVKIRADRMDISRKLLELGINGY